MGPLQEYRLGAGRPSIVITAGIHGNEQTAIYAAELIYSLLQKETLLGEVCILPRCNPSAIRARERKAPEDGLDLNRSFPGAPDGSHTQRLAYEIWRQTEGFDYVLDLHCCGLYGTTYAMHYFKKYAFAKPLCKMLGVPHVVSSKGTRGQLYIESCEQRGQKGILIELPGGQPGGVIYEDAAEASRSGRIAAAWFVPRRPRGTWCVKGMRSPIWTISPSSPPAADSSPASRPFGTCAGGRICCASLPIWKNELRCLRKEV